MSGRVLVVLFMFSTTTLPLANLLFFYLNKVLSRFRQAGEKKDSNEPISQVFVARELKCLF
ncbi:hypothetical protein EE612_057284 [Oryza sativa]|nr:hypothetical protein EE612_057284 [Oryza sativa]